MPVCTTYKKNPSKSLDGATAGSKFNEVGATYLGEVQGRKILIFGRYNNYC